MTRRLCRSLYEGRHVEMEQDKAAVDLWFERYTADLSEKQKADLKKKYSRANTLNKAKRVVYMRAFDISEHYRANWQGTGFQGRNWLRRTKPRPFNITSL